MKPVHFTRFVFAMLLLGTFFSSCKKEDDPSDDNTDPACTGCETIQALAANDSLSTGVYKGLLLTGTGIGHFRVNVKNGSEDLFMVMKYTRETYPVLNDSLKPTTTVTVNPNADVNVTLLGSGSRTTFYSSPFGNPSVGDFTLSGSIGTGPKPQAAVLKELSTAQVKVYEGTMQESSASAPNGKVGFVVRGNTIVGIITNANNTLRESFYNGTIGADKKFSFSFSGNNSTYSGELVNDNEITGTFSLQNTPAGTFTAKRAF